MCRRALIQRTLTIPVWMRAAVVAFAAAFVVHSVAAAFINTTRDKQDWHNDHRRIAETIPRGTKVLAHLDFVCDELENFEIAGMRLAYWRIAEWSDRRYDFDNLARYADSAGADAIVLDRAERSKLVACPSALGERTGPFTLVRQLDDVGLWLWMREVSDRMVTDSVRVSGGSE